MDIYGGGGYLPDPFGLEAEDPSLAEARINALRRQGPQVKSVKITQRGPANGGLPPPTPVPPTPQVPQPPRVDPMANLQTQHAEAMSAQERLMQPPDTTQLQNYAREREQGGTRQLMLALAAQEAGKEFAPAQAHFLKQAAAARDPMKFGGGLVAETGEFVADPSAQADLKIRQAGMRIQAIERQIQAAQSAQERAALQAERLNAQAELRSMMMQFQAGQDARASADRRYGVDMAHENAKIAAAAKPGPKDKVAENAAKNAAAGKEVLGLLDEAEKHLDNATSSYIGYGVDQGLRAFGGSTKGSRATAALQTIGGQIVSKMPRMEGPQSNYDVKLYQQMAGRLDDPTVPLGDKKVALQTLRDLNDKYAIGGAALSPGGGATGGWSVEVEK